MTIHLVNAFTDSPTADCCGATLADLPAEQITLDPDAVTCRPSQEIDWADEDGGPACGWLQEPSSTRFGCVQPAGHSGNCRFGKHPSKMSDAELEAEADRWSEGDTAEYAEAQQNRWSAVEREIEAREDWNHEDARVRESVGNYS